MTLKKYEESSIAKPFSIGALMALTRLTGPGQLHPGLPPCPGPRTPSQPPKPSPLGGEGPERCLVPRAGATHLLVMVVGQEQTGDTLWFQTVQPQKATNPPMQQPDIHKQLNNLTSLL